MDRLRAPSRAAGPPFRVVLAVLGGLVFCAAVQAQMLLVLTRGPARLPAPVLAGCLAAALVAFQRTGRPVAHGLAAWAGGAVLLLATHPYLWMGTWRIGPALLWYVSPGLIGAVAASWALEEALDRLAPGRTPVPAMLARWDRAWLGLSRRTRRAVAAAAVVGLLATPAVRAAWTYHGPGPVKTARQFGAALQRQDFTGLSQLVLSRRGQDWWWVPEPPPPAGHERLARAVLLSNLPAGFRVDVVSTPIGPVDRPGPGIPKCMVYLGFFDSQGKLLPGGFNDAGLWPEMPKAKAVVQLPVAYCGRGKGWKVRADEFYYNLEEERTFWPKRVPPYWRGLWVKCGGEPIEEVGYGVVVKRVRR